MYDFLDKIGLKAVLEVVKSKLSGKSDNGHTHSKSEITDFPTSLPANGGNAESCNTAKYLGTFGGAGEYYGSQLPMRCLYNKFGDLRFGLTTDTDNEIRVDYATNADTLDGLHSDDLAKSENPTINGVFKLQNSNITTSPPMIFAYNDSLRIRNIDDDTIENHSYTDLVITPYGIYSESKQNGVYLGIWKMSILKSVTVGGTTDVVANIPLWTKSENKIPVFIECAEYCVIPFIGSSGYYYCYFYDVSNHAPAAGVAVTCTVWYIEI